MQLSTKRLLLREVRTEDKLKFIKYSQHPDFSRYENPELVVGEAIASMTNYMIDTQEDRPRIHFYFSITLKDQPTHALGAIYVSIRDHENRQAEIGYILGVPYWNNGYTTEAAQRMLEFGFDELKMHRIYADEIITENIGSIRVAEKLGMCREAHFRQYRFFHDRWWDTYTYAILYDEWAATQDS